LQRNWRLTTVNSVYTCMHKISATITCTSNVVRIVNYNFKIQSHGTRHHTIFYVRKSSSQKHATLQHNNERTTGWPKKVSHYEMIKKSY